jgi:NhaA family Na+:H+ antiporter
LPVLAAFGGIIFPALIFMALNGGNIEAMRGWAVPTATDIAFSLGILSLLGKRVPFSLKIFLTALAIIDDLGAILIIAIFYSHGINFIMILLAILVIILLFYLNKMNVTHYSFYIIGGIALWYFILQSGIHPTIAGVLFAITIPMSLLDDLEHKLSKPVNYIVLPVFALANTAMPISLGLTDYLVTPLSAGILLGLLIGKPLGITSVAYIAVKFKFAVLPDGIHWKQILGVGLIAGIGFTMSIFIASLSFEPGFPLILSKLSILAGSFFSAVAGTAVLYLTSRE